ncbi:hypothetical protein KUTeg_015531 [Tegillarca granosa]|uniref:HD domain-containing protein n=1 Tax=Tegillarca granosa TaxID=220873 RepID=A0ABQ9EQC0_TEGGR|nr:hypothetical protein KUTeg_015531 [Tegillarca granosa]
MIFEPYLVKIINHPYFQRLRHIKQLQGVEHVYPGGVHTRFSHSLGVCFLAGKVLDNLKRTFETEKSGHKISDFDKKCVTIAALCHDIVVTLGQTPLGIRLKSLNTRVTLPSCTLIRTAFSKYRL